MVLESTAECGDTVMVLTHSRESIIILRGNTIEEVCPSEAKWN